MGRGALRKIGREAEYPVVTASGDAADVRALWPVLLDGGGFQPVREESLREGSMIVGLRGEDVDFSLEVGWGTVELISRPCEDLHELAEVQEAGMKRLLEAAASLDFHVLGYGIQPKTPASVHLMSPKDRYAILHQAIGETWLWFTSTASDQLHVDVSLGELVPMLNFANLMTPVSIALCANSPIYAGADGGFCSCREGHMKEIFAQSHRHGMLAAPITSLQDWVDLTARQLFLVQRKGKEYTLMQGSFADYMRREGADFESFLVHDHYIWNSARARTAHGTIELRSPCQQPWGAHMAAVALGLGLMEAAEELNPWLETQLGEELWPVMRSYHQAVIAEGLAAQEPFEGFLQGVLERCSDALGARSKGEEAFLKPLWERLAARKNPAQVAREVFRTGGMESLVAHLTCKAD